MVKYCPKCGRPGVEAMKFCAQCGQRLTGSGSHEARGYVSRAEATTKERSWFERHLNWTMVLAWLGTYPAGFIVGLLMVLGDPTIPEDELQAIGIVVSLVITIAVGRWVLKKKNRSMWYLLLSPFIFFLLIENHSFTRDEYGRTMADYNKLIALDPTNAEAYYERGDFHYELDEHDKAIADYSRAIDLNLGHALAYFSRACAYGEIGEYDKAIADYSKAIELDPSDAQAYYNRGLDYQNKGEVSYALSDLEKAIELSSDPELKEDARQALHRIKNPF